MLSHTVHELAVHWAANWLTDWFMIACMQYVAWVSTCNRSHCQHTLHTRLTSLRDYVITVQIQNTRLLSGTRAVSDEQSPLGSTLIPSRHNCMKYRSDFMQLCLEGIKVQPSGDCSSETALVPLLYESKYAIKNCLTLLVSDLIFSYLKQICLKFNLYYTI